MSRLQRFLSETCQENCRSQMDISYRLLSHLSFQHLLHSKEPSPKLSRKNPFSLGGANLGLYSSVLIAKEQLV